MPKTPATDGQQDDRRCSWRELAPGGRQYRKNTAPMLKTMLEVCDVPWASRTAGDSAVEARAIAHAEQQG